MIANTVAYLLILGLLMLLHGRLRHDRTTALAAFCLAGGIFYYFLSGWQAGVSADFQLLWDSSRSGDIKIDIVSVAHNYIMIFPFFIVTLTAMLNNLFLNQEHQKKIFSALLCLNLVCLMMLISGNNFVQVMTFVFGVDILSQLLIKDIQASRRYTIYNLVADMGLFLVLAMVRGRLENLDIANIGRYYETGRHRDFLTAVILISLFIKSGFFLFQGYMLDLKGTRFHRLILIPYLSTPAVSLILLVKMYPLLVVSPMFYPVFDVVVTLSILWGFIACVIIDNLKEKTIYLNMMIMGLLAKILESSDFIWNESFSWMLVLGFLFNLCIYYLHYFAGRENDILLIARMRRGDPNLFRFVLVAWLIITAAFGAQLAEVINERNQIWIAGFGGLFLFAAAHMFSRMSCGRNEQTEKKSADLKPLPVLMVVMAGAGAVLYLQRQFLGYAVAAMSIFVLLLFFCSTVCPALNLRLNVKNQNLDFFTHVYKAVLTGPIEFVGRVLTVLVDFVLIEKTFTATFAWVSGLLIRVFRKISRGGAAYYMLCTLIAIAVCLWSFLRGNF